MSLASLPGLNPDGSIALPGISFANDTDTGFYRGGPNYMVAITSGVPCVHFDSNGHVSVGATPHSSSQFYVYEDISSLNNHQILYSVASISGIPNTSVFYNNSILSTTYSNSPNSGTLYGLTNYNNKIGQGLVANSIGIYSAIQNLSSGYINAAYSFYGEIISNHPTGTINNAYSIYSNISKTAGTIQNGYNIYINGNTANNPYAIYSAANNPSYMLGVLRLGADVAGQGTLFVQAPFVCQTSRINEASASINTSHVFNYFTDNVGTVLGSVAGTAVAGVIAYNTFTGSHWTKVQGSQGRLRDLMLLESIGLPLNHRNDKEQLVRTRICSTYKSKAVMGVYGGTNKDGDDLVLALGTAFVLACTLDNVNIENGDYLTSSTISGCCQLQDDDLLHNYTVAKSLVDVNWNTVSINPQLGVKVKKIPVTLHCG